MEVTYRGVNSPGRSDQSSMGPEERVTRAIGNTALLVFRELTDQWCAIDTEHLITRQADRHHRDSGSWNFIQAQRLSARVQSHDERASGIGLSVGVQVNTISSANRELAVRDRRGECLTEVDIRGSFVRKRHYLGSCHREWRQQFEIRPLE